MRHVTQQSCVMTVMCHRFCSKHANQARMVCCKRHAYLGGLRGRWCGLRGGSRGVQHPHHHCHCPEGLHACTKGILSGHMQNINILLHMSARHSCVITLTERTGARSALFGRASKSCLCSVSWSVWLYTFLTT